MLAMPSKSKYKILTWFYYNVNLKSKNQNLIEINKLQTENQCNLENVLTNWKLHKTTKKMSNT